MRRAALRDLLPSHFRFEFNQHQFATWRKDLVAVEINMKVSRISLVAQKISKRTISHDRTSVSVRECGGITTCRPQTVLCTSRSRAILYNNSYANRFQSNGPIRHRSPRRYVVPHGIGECTQRRYASQSSGAGNALQQTALHDLHVARGGKMVPFGGYSMPVQYEDLGVGESHKWTREKASLFDVGHM